MVSIIVPVYNVEEYLSRCIDSILAQTFTEFELLLIDDGSTDSSGIICDEYKNKDDRIRVFHKKNGGVSSARNIGIENANGDWLAFVDSDDYVYSTFLETYVELYSGEVELCILGIVPDYSISAEYKITNTSIDYNGDLKGALSLLYNCKMFGSLCNKCFKKSVIDKNDLRFNELYRFREDEEFLLRYMSHVKQVAATTMQSYVYIVPDWNKYNNSENLLTLCSMYRSVLSIYEGKANNITDLYQTELYKEYLSLLRIDKYKSMKQLFVVISTIGWHIFRFSPFKELCKKIIEFVRK